MRTIRKIWFSGNRIFLETENNEKYSRPLEAFPVLKDANEKQRESYSIGSDKTDIRWEELDEDIHINSFFETIEPDHNNTEIPQKVYEVLKYIRANHRAMDGYVGGRVFTNREKIVPQEDGNGNPITYQEWDVNPKIQGQNRGTERILTGSDGRAWYTNDHYQSFKEIK